MGLLGFCALVFFWGIGSYPLMDVDETRYASMARDMFLSKDFMTLRLNGEYFFEKPPLYFWLECASFALFGKINEFTVRFPVALCGMLSAFALYFAGKKVVSRKYGITAAVILATSLQFNVLSKFAILDIVLAACAGLAVVCGFLTFYVQEQNKKYFWWLFYIFSALAVLAKGVPGVVVPFGVMFCAAVALGKGRELFRPQYLFVGLILFASIVVPWHQTMLEMYPNLFWDEYVVKHHLQRFAGGEEIGRTQGWWFYIPTFLVGFIPWIAFVNPRKIWLERTTNQWLYLNLIGFAFTFLFFSVSGTKLITYILPLFFFAANIVAFCIVNLERFAVTAGVMACILAFGTGPAFKFNFTFGQDDLMHYAKTYRPIASFGVGRKYSLLYYSGGYIKRKPEIDYAWLEKTLKTTYVVVKNSDVEKFSQHAKFEIVETGKKYTLIKSADLKPAGRVKNGL